MQNYRCLIPITVTIINGTYHFKARIYSGSISLVHTSLSIANTWRSHGNTFRLEDNI